MGSALWPFLKFLRQLLCVSSCLFGLATTAHADTTDINNVRITKTVHGVTTVDANGHLPYLWNRVNGDVAGQARFLAEVWIADPSQPLTIYIPRLGSTFLIHVNGHELARFGTLPPNAYDDAATRPHLFTVPAQWLSPRTTIAVEIGVGNGRWGGLSAMTIGSAGEVHRASVPEYLLEVTGRKILAVVTLVLGCFAFLLWTRQRDRAYLYYALAEILWTVGTSRPLFSDVPLPWPLWGTLFTAAYALAIALQCKFALMIVGRDRGWPHRSNLVVVLLVIPTACLQVLVGAKWIAALGAFLLVSNFFVMVWTVVSQTWRSKALEHKVLQVALCIVLICGIYATAQLIGSVGLYHFAFTRFAWTGFGISFAWVIVERMRNASDALASMNETLSRQLAIRSNELAQAYARERLANIDQGAMLERQRLTRDLHDGLGGHLVGALRMSKLASVSKEDVAHQLRVAVDQLRVTVDAMQETDGDIPSLLGAVRYRLARRLNAAGIALTWRVDQLPSLANWGVRQSYELQMILFEVFTNMMVHSGASQAVLEGRSIETASGLSIAIDISDNGTGFSVENARDGGRGIANMKARAEKLGAVLTMSSRPGETRTRVLLVGPVIED